MRSGRLHLVHRGVYAVGHSVLTIEGRWMAAGLAAGPNAVLSHATAAAAWELPPLGSGAIPRHRPRRPGTQAPRRHPHPPQRHPATERHQQPPRHPRHLPVRTLIDLATTLAGRPLEIAVDRADQLGLVDFKDLTKRPIPRSLQALLSRYTTTTTRSELEDRFLQLCADHGLPRPETNISIEGLVVDFVWRSARLIVEVDGYRYRRSPSAFEADRERDVVLALAGWQVLRFTWAQVTRRPRWVAAAVAQRLAS